MRGELSKRRAVTDTGRATHATAGRSKSPHSSGDLNERISALDAGTLGRELTARGYSLVPGFLSEPECRDLIGLFDEPEAFRKTVSMERYRFGRGCYRYWRYPLPPIVAALREGLYPLLEPVANQWMRWLDDRMRYPETLAGLRRACADVGQHEPTPLILRYGEGGFNTLHQDLYGEMFFPIQAAIVLSEVNEEYTGGEFVLTEQIPRAQSKATVLQPRRGDLLLFTTNYRPVEGKRGYYRATMRHGVSEVHRGNRYTLGIIFHDANT